MTTLADRTVAANRAVQDRLAPLVRRLDEQDLSRPSGASEWSVAQVVSHLGSGAEIGLDTLRAAQTGTPRPADANHAVWARWDALAPSEQASGFLCAGEELVAAYEALDVEQRETLRIEMGFLPQPADVTLLTGLRLNEAALHAWDVEVAFDPAAALPSDVAGVLLEQQQGPLGFLLGWVAQPARLDGRRASLLVRTTGPETQVGLELGDAVALAAVPASPDGELRLPAEALLRLLAGRLGPTHTPDDVELTGPLTLADLRQVFPGF